MRKQILYILLLALVTNLAYTQDKPVRKFDRRKWQELVKEVEGKRYNARDTPGEEPEEAASPENEYYNSEGSEYSSESAEYNTQTDEGIYDGSSSSDDIFFDERNDKNGTGNGTRNGDPGEIDPRYNDHEGNGTGSGNQGGGDYNSYQDNKTSEEDVYYRRNRPQPPSRSSSSSSSSSGGGGDASWLLYVLIAILAVAVVYMILVSFGDKNKKVAAVEVEENKFENLTITKSELELALEAALKNKNFREAVRIYFIAVIKEMKDRRWIKWEKKKTNYHYINEITGRSQQPDFITATRAFEIVWYGNRNPAEAEYHQQIEPVFKKLLSSMHS